MALSKESIRENFVCTKCRNRASLVQDLALPNRMMIPVPSTRYVSVSCSLCGYTEFYNLAIIVHEEEEERELRGDVEPA